MKDPSKNDTLDGLLRALDEGISLQERHTHRPIGPTGPSGDFRNWVGPGSDERIYINSVIASVTPPTYVDFGGGVIPVGAVWLELGERPIEGGWCDDFERVSLGPDWAPGPLVDGITLHAPVSIQTGAVISDDNQDADFNLQMGSIRTTREFPGDQTVELVIGNLFQGHDPDMAEWYQYVECENHLFTQVNAGTNACIGAWVYISTNSIPAYQDGYCEIDIVTVDADGNRDYFDYGVVAPLADWRDNPSWRVRLETTAAGHVKAYFEGELVAEDDVPPMTGPYVGFSSFWNPTNYGDALVDGTNPGTSPRYEEICVNMPPGTPA